MQGTHTKTGDGSGGMDSPHMEHAHLQKAQAWGAARQAALKELGSAEARGRHAEHAPPCAYCVRGEIMLGPAPITKCKQIHMVAQACTAQRTSQGCPAISWKKGLLGLLWVAWHGGHLQDKEHWCAVLEHFLVR